MFPDVSIMRMDTDTMRKPGSHEKALAKFRSGETKILLGTQMIAKGLDFPNVTLVGVINADTALHLPDFRASERTFGLITQVAGRTGRGAKGGRVLVQTFNPENKAIVAATTMTMSVLQQTNCRIAKSFIIRRLVFWPASSSAANQKPRPNKWQTTSPNRSRIAATELEADVTVLGPAVAPVEKLRGMYRFHILLGAQVAGQLQASIRRAESKIKSIDGVQWIVDIDPQDML